MVLLRTSPLSLSTWTDYQIYFHGASFCERTCSIEERARPREIEASPLINNDRSLPQMFHTGWKGSFLPPRDIRLFMTDSRKKSVLYWRYKKKTRGQACSQLGAEDRLASEKSSKIFIRIPCGSLLKCVSYVEDGTWETAENSHVMVCLEVLFVNVLRIMFGPNTTLCSLGVMEIIGTILRQILACSVQADHRHSTSTGQPTTSPRSYH